jgi:hypothetical protein
LPPQRLSAALQKRHIDVAPRGCSLRETASACFAKQDVQRRERGKRKTPRGKRIARRAASCFLLRS